MSTQFRLPEGSICLPVSALGAAAKEVQHAASRITRRAACGEGACGSTRWEIRSGDSVAWVEWDWSEDADGDLVQADPTSIRSNVLLLDDGSRPLLSSRRRATLASLVYQLPWKGPVLDELRKANPLSLRSHAAFRVAA